jgi:hypothetical protein
MSPAAQRSKPTARLTLATVVIGGVLLFGGLLVSGAQAAAPGEAEVLASSPAPLTSVAVDPTTGLIYALEYQGTKAFSYKSSTNAWSEIAEAPINIGNNGGATYLNGKLYASSTGNGEFLEVYDIATDTWTTMTSPLGEGTADITAVGEELYMVVGTHFVEYDPATEVTTTLAEAPTFAPVGCGEGFEAWGGLQPYKGKIYGTQGDGCRGFAVYDIESNTWTELPETPLAEGEGEGPVAGSALDPVSETYFAYGGYEGDSLFEYDIPTNSWTIFTLPFAVNDGGLAYVALSGLRGIYAIQGQSGSEFVRYVTPEPVSETPAPKTVVDAPGPTVSTPTPTPTPAPTATVAPAAQCVSSRSESIHWKTVQGVHLRSVLVTVNGRTYTRLPGGARSVDVNLAGATIGAVTVKIMGRADSGRMYTSARVYHPCEGRHASAALGSLFLAAARLSA